MKRALSVALASLALFSCNSQDQKSSVGGPPPGTVVEQNNRIPRPEPQAQPTPTPSSVSGCAQRTLTILGTNDIHGNFEGKVFAPNGGANAPKRTIGGLAEFAGIVSAARAKSDDCNGVLVVDAGDQFQGTLISNFNEGLLMADVLREVGYDAVIPGNHDYDFGPIGWENDSVTQATEANVAAKVASRLNGLERFGLAAQARITLKKVSPAPRISGKMNDATDPSTPAPVSVESLDPKATIVRFQKEAQLPLLSANTYELNSLVDKDGNPVANPTLVGCHVATGTAPIDWSKAKRPSYLGASVTKIVAGLKVAIVGLDLTGTPTVTTKANVLDLCFRDPVEEFLALSAELKKSVDAIVVVGHFGDGAYEVNIVRDASATVLAGSPADDITLSSFLDRVLTSPGCSDGKCIDAVVAGHSHQVNEVRISNIPGIQSGSNAQRFGRIELQFDGTTKTPVRSATKTFPGKYFGAGYCDTGTESFCSLDANGLTIYDGTPAVTNAKIAGMIATEKAKTADVAGRILGKATGSLNPNRIDENNLGDRLADMLLEIAKPQGATVSFLNSGGIRTSVKAGDVTYSAFYEVLPFNNRATVIPDYRVSDLIRAITLTIQTCGNYGALNFGGIRVQYRRDCTGDNAKTQLDLNAELIRVETTAGEVLYDGSRPADQRMIADHELTLVTLDFLADGGSGFGAAFRPEMTKNVIPRPFRENFVSAWLDAPFLWDPKTDRRMVNLFAASSASASAGR